MDNSETTLKQNDSLCINALRFLAIDAVQKANSGHPGLPLDAAPMAYAVWDRFLKYNSSDPKWPNRDRFVLSAGHGSALLYSLLHLSGYDLSIDALEHFRQWQSQTPGHPEYGRTPGVEATTGPLGQGFANAVGMAIAEQVLAAQYNRGPHVIFDHYTYVIASDGDMMEGISSEAASLAGHLRLGKLIVLYDDNHISIEGNTSLAFSENVTQRFAAYGWHTQALNDGNDLNGIIEAIRTAREATDRPSLIAIRTHIGFGSPHKQDTAAAHGEPLGEDEVKLTKEHLGWPLKPDFYVPREVEEHFHIANERGRQAQLEWKKTLLRYSVEYPDLNMQLHRVFSSELPADLDCGTVPANIKSMATRDASEIAINSLATLLPEFIGGAADLAPSTKTKIKCRDEQNFSAAHRNGRNLHFGVREHAMGGILNGIALHGGLIAFGATFLIFSDYMRPAIRLAAMSGLPVVYVFTHDSIGLGEDGPTHQPIEQLLGLRSVPGLTVIRPADAHETLAAWSWAIHHRTGPTALILTRQKLPLIELNQGSDIARGGYVISDSKLNKDLDLTLVATGSEVHLALAAQRRLHEENFAVRVVSLPSWNLFAAQPKAYRNQVVPPLVPKLIIEAGTSLGWKSYLGGEDDLQTISIDHYGASAPGETVLEKNGFNVENVCQRARAIAKFERADT